MQTPTSRLTTVRVANGEFETFWDGARTRYGISQTANIWGIGRRVPHYAITWVGKDGQPKHKHVGGLAAAKRVLAQCLAAKAEGR